MTIRIACTLAALLAATATPPARAQAPAEFEVASVKPNLADDRIVTVHIDPGGRFTARGYTLALLIQRAYGVMDWNISGGPAWIRVDRYDVAAKANIEGEFTEAMLRPMLANLLADRFKLRLRPSTERVPGYALQVARRGDGLRTSAADNPYSFRFSNLGMSAQGISMRDFARFFGGKLGFILVDETGLPGFYDFDVNWKVQPGNPAGAFLGADPRDPLRDAALEALRARLGLRVVPKKVTIETLVVEHAEKVTGREN